MELLEKIFSYIAYGIGGFFVFIIGLFLLALIFGKRVEKKWEYEADFHDEKNREIGEFDIEMSKYAKEKGDFKLKAKFKLRHPELTTAKIVKIYLNDVLVMEGPVVNSGRIYLTEEHLKDSIENPESGQICRVVCSATELFSVPIHKDN